MSDLITITGNMAAEPELRRTPAGVPVASFRVGSSQRYYDRDKSEWIETATNWYSISAFRALAEHVCSSLHKGERVIVAGRVRMREWETATKRGVSVEIEAEAVGHDLRWGTTRFERAQTKAAEGGAWPSSSSSGDSSRASAQDWAPDATDGRSSAAHDWGGTPAVTTELSHDGASHPTGPYAVEPPF